MNKDRQSSDILEDLFRKMPETELPASFRQNVMQQVMLEAAKQKKRNERFGLIAVIAASLLMVALAICALLYMDLPRLSLPRFNGSDYSFYFYIGILTLLLLFADYKVRRAFHKDE